MNWRHFPTACLWAVGGLLILVPLVLFVPERFLPSGRTSTLVWGSLPIGMVAGWLHRDWGVGLLTVLAVVLLSIVVNMVMFLFALDLGAV